MDIRGAFDNVRLSKLLRQLKEWGLADRLLRSLSRSLERGRVYMRRWDGTLFECGPQEDDKGLKQGSPLSPYLFNLTIAAVLERFNAERQSGPWTKGIWYADDLVILAASRDALQTFIDEIQLILDEWGLEFSPEKCKIMEVRPAGPISDAGNRTMTATGRGQDRKIYIKESQPPPYGSGGSYGTGPRESAPNAAREPEDGSNAGGRIAIDQVDSFTYLGVVIKNDLGIDAHLKARLAKARAVHQWFLSAAPMQCLPYHRVIGIWRVLVLSVAYYGVASVTLGRLKAWQDIDMMVKATVRRLVQLPPNTPEGLLFSDAGVRPSVVELHCRAAKLFGSLALCQSVDGGPMHDGTFVCWPQQTIGKMLKRVVVPCLRPGVHRRPGLRGKRVSTIRHRAAAAKPRRTTRKWWEPWRSMCETVAPECWSRVPAFPSNHGEAEASGGAPQPRATGNTAQASRSEERKADTAPRPSPSLLGTKGAAPRKGHRALLPRGTATIGWQLLKDSTDKWVHDSGIELYVRWCKKSKRLALLPDVEGKLSSVWPLQTTTPATQDGSTHPTVRKTRQKWWTPPRFYTYMGTSHKATTAMFYLRGGMCHYPKQAPSPPRYRKTPILNTTSIAGERPLLQWITGHRGALKELLMQYETKACAILCQELHWTSDQLMRFLLRENLGALERATSCFAHSRSSPEWSAALAAMGEANPPATLDANPVQMGSGIGRRSVPPQPRGARLGREPVGQIERCPSRWGWHIRTVKAILQWGGCIQALTYGIRSYKENLPSVPPAPADDWVLSPLVAPRVGAVTDNLAELLDDQPSFVVNKLNRVLVILVCRWVEQVFLSWTSGSPLTLPHWQSR